jgi:hypothetical protein
MKRIIFLIFFGFTAVISGQFTGGFFSNMYNISTGTLLYNPGGEAIETEDSKVAARLTLKVFKGYGRVPLSPLSPHFRCMDYDKMKAEDSKTWFNKDDKGRNVWTFEHISDSQYVIKNNKYNVALTAKGETQIIPEPFNEGNENQIFIMTRVQKDFRYAYYLKTKSGNTAVTSNSSGTLVYQRPFVKGNRNQMWVNSDRYRFESASSGNLAPPENVELKPGVKLETVLNRDKPIVKWETITHPTGDHIYYIRHVQSGLFLAYPETDTSGAIGFNATLQDYNRDYNLLFVFRRKEESTAKSTYAIVVYPNEKECLAYSYGDGIIGEQFVPETQSKSQLWVVKK